MKSLKQVCFLLLVSVLAYGQPNAVSLLHTEEFVLFSSPIQDTFYIQVSLPPNYQDEEAQYPVIYLLDADKSFAMTKGIVEWLKFDRVIPEVIIVGIAYKKKWWQKRSRDYTPTKDKMNNWGDWPLAGGADNFLRFIDEELNNKLKDYRIDWTNKTIIGHSFGGLLATYALFLKPDLFDHYLSVSPALIWDDKYLFKINLDKLRTNPRPVSVFTTIGDQDGPQISEC